MHSKAIIIVFVVFIGCKKPFSNTSETVLALPLNLAQKQESVVFITGFDEGDNRYYTNANAYFSGRGIPVVDTLFSLAEIIAWLNQKAEHQTSFSEIHIVSHSNAWLGMSLRTTKNGERITFETLQEVQRDSRFPKIKGGVTHQTKVVFHSCGLGENQVLLRELKRVFSNTGSSTNSNTNRSSCSNLNSNSNTSSKSNSKPHSNTNRPRVYASTFFNVFGGKFAGHYLAQPYYGFYPTGESKGPLYLSEEFKKEYPETPIDWFAAVKTRKETHAGVPYSYKFNIPVSWEFTFEDTKDIPVLEDKEALLDFISESPQMTETLFELKIPLEKYRWKSEIHGNKLHIKGKTTVLCVLAPILQDAFSNEYRKPRVNDRSLYQIL